VKQIFATLLPSQGTYTLTAKLNDIFCL